MSTESADTDTSTHVDQSIPFEWRAVEHAGQTLVVHDVPEGLPQCYRVTETTRNVRALALSSVDAILYEGTLVEPFYDEDTRRVVLQHAYAGTKAGLVPGDWLEQPVVRLHRCEHVDLDQRLKEGDRDV